MFMQLKNLPLRKMLGWVGENYGSILHNSMFWGVFLGLQPSCAAARLCFPVEWFQRILLTTVANTQPERAVQYGMDTIAIANLRKRHPDLQYSIGLYCNTLFTIFDSTATCRIKSWQDVNYDFQVDTVSMLHLQHSIGLYYNKVLPTTFDWFVL